MNWQDFYLFCFAVGFVSSALSFVSGHLHWHFGHGHSHGGHAHGHMMPFSPATVAAFLAWFGGAGYLATHYYRVWFLAALGIAAAMGAIGATVVFLFLAKVLMRDERALDPADYSMVGVLGTVSGAIRPEGTGEILFSQEGARRCAGARSEDGKGIPSGVEVVVTRYEQGIAYVRRWDELMSME